MLSSYEKFNDLFSEKNTKTRKNEIQGETGKTYDEYLDLYGNHVADTIINRGTISKNIGTKPKTIKGYDDWNAHHIIPVEAIENSQLIRDAIKQGFSFNGKANAKWLRRYSSELRTNPKTGKIIASPHGSHASHDAYNQKIIELLRKFENSKGYNPEKAKEYAEFISNKVIKKIDNMLDANQKYIKENLGKGRKIEDILKDKNIIRINQLEI